jgi:Xaa-Pro aminopeptidase
MKQDLDVLMQTYHLDAILVTGPGTHNPAMVYLTGGAFLTNADLIKKRGCDPVLFYRSMERDGAAQTGLETKNLDDFRYEDLLKQAGGDALQATALRYQRMLTDLDLTSGRIAVYGLSDAGVAFALFSAVQKLMPEVSFVGEVSDSMLMEVMATKDEAEVDRIRRMGQITTSVIAQTAEFLTSHQVRGDTLIKPDGSPLLTGEVKRQIDLWLVERGVENPEGTIFAIGRTAGVPHNVGDPADPLQLGKTIVFDIFPCEAGGGYFYDITRTWCLGYATDEAYKLYEDVLSVYQQIRSELQPGALTSGYQARACELFEAQGHVTICSDPLTQVGYVHGLGHGVGLYIHERPFFSIYSPERDRLNPGTVITVEPGLYYPEKGLGVRLEDTVWIRPDGQIETLAEFPLDLVLPMKA